MVQLGSFRRRRRFMPARLSPAPNPYFSKTRNRGAAGSSRRGMYVALALVSLAVIGACAWLFTSSHYRITTVTVDANNDSLRKEIETAAHTYLGTSTLGFFRSENYWLLNNGQLHDYIDAHLADKVKLQTLTVKKQYPNLLNITAASYQPFVRYQGVGSIVYVLDDKGIVTGKYEEPQTLDANTNAMVSAPTTIPLLHDENDRLAQIGNQMVSAKLITAVDTLYRAQDTYSVAFDSFSIPEIHCPVPPATLNAAGDLNTNTATEMPNENTSVSNTNTTGNLNTNTSLPACDRSQLILETTQVNAKLVDGPKVYFSFAYDLTEELDRLRLFINSKKAEVKGMIYIDVRFPERIYYQ